MSMRASLKNVVKHYLGTVLFVDSSMNFTASDFLFESKMCKTSTKAALCIKESANRNKIKKLS